MSGINLAFWKEFSLGDYCGRCVWGGAHFCVMGSAFCCSHPFVHCGSPFSCYSSNIMLPSVIQWMCTNLTKSLPLNRYSLFFFFTQIMRNSEYIKTNIKNFKDKRTSLPWYIVYLLLQYKTRKRWTQVLFININHYICLRLILSCKIDTLLLTKSQSPSQFYNFQKVQMRNM